MSFKVLYDKLKTYTVILKTYIFSRQDSTKYFYFNLGKVDNIPLPSQNAFEVLILHLCKVVANLILMSFEVNIQRACRSLT